MTRLPTPSHRRILFRPALALAVALSCVAAPAVSQVKEDQAASPVIATGCTPAAPVDHAINTKGAGGSDRMAAAKPAAPCAAPAEPVATDHAIHPACQKAADKIACNRFEDFKATHKDDQGGARQSIGLQAAYDPANIFTSNGRTWSMPG